MASNPFDDDPPVTSSENGALDKSTDDNNGTATSTAAPTNGKRIDDPTARARRRREEAVSRLVADATRYNKHPNTIEGNNADSSSNLNSQHHDGTVSSPQHSALLLASTIASSIERGLDRELHSELVRQGKDATERISKICHDYSEEFLESVGRVVTALGGPCEEVRSSLEEVRMNWCVHYEYCFIQ